jgi:hypothetical protein
MSMLSRINKLKSASKGFAKAHGIVPRYLKTTAPLWTIEREGRNDCVSPDLQGSLKTGDIRGMVTLLSEKVERRPIMPNLVCLLGLPDLASATIQ